MSITVMSFTRSILPLIIITSHQAHEQKSITLHPSLNQCQAEDTCPTPPVLKTSVIDDWEESFSISGSIPSAAIPRLETINEATKTGQAYNSLSCNPPAIKVEFPKSCMNEGIPSPHGSLWDIWTHFVRIMYENQDLFLHYLHCFLFYCFLSLLIKLVFFLYLVYQRMKLLSRRTSHEHNSNWDTEEECPYCCCSCRFK